METVEMHNGAEKTGNGFTTINLAEVIATTVRLGHVLAEETLMLRSRSISNLASLQEEKNRLISILEAIKNIIGKNPALLNNLPADQVAEFQRISTHFNVILQENHKELNKARMLNQKVIEIITRAALDQVNHNIGYNKTGQIGYRQTSNTLLPPLSINDKI